MKPKMGQIAWVKCRVYETGSRGNYHVRSDGQSIVAEPKDIRPNVTRKQLEDWYKGVIAFKDLCALVLGDKK